MQPRHDAHHGRRCSPSAAGSSHLALQHLSLLPEEAHKAAAAEVSTAAGVEAPPTVSVDEAVDDFARRADARFEGLCLEPAVASAVRGMLEELAGEAPEPTKRRKAAGDELGGGGGSITEQPAGAAVRAADAANRSA